MTRCTLCYHLFQPDERLQTGELVSCSLCLVRTTPAARRNFLRGQRIPYCYLDSD